MAAVVGTSPERRRSTDGLISAVPAVAAVLGVSPSRLAKLDPNQKAALTAALIGDSTQLAKKLPPKRRSQGKKKSDAGEGAAQKSKKSEKGERGDRAVWTEDEEDFLLEKYKQFIQSGQGNLMGTAASKLAPLLEQLQKAFHDRHPSKYTLKNTKQVKQKIDNWKKRYRAVKAECAHLRREKTATGRETKSFDVDEERAVDMWRLWDTFHDAFQSDPTLNPELAQEDGLSGSENEGLGEDGGEPDEEGEDDLDGEQEEDGPRRPAAWSPPPPPEEDDEEQPGPVQDGEQGPPDPTSARTPGSQQSSRANTAAPGASAKKAGPAGAKKKGPDLEKLAKKPSADGNGGDEAGAGPRIASREQRANAAVAGLLAESRASSERLRERELQLELQDRAEGRRFQSEMMQANLNTQAQLAMFQAQQSRETMLFLGAMLQGNLPPSFASAAPPAFGADSSFTSAPSGQMPFPFSFGSFMQPGSAAQQSPFGTPSTFTQFGQPFQSDFPRASRSPLDPFPAARPDGTEDMGFAARNPDSVHRDSPSQAFPGDVDGADANTSSPEMSDS